MLSMSNALPAANITTVRKGKRIGVNRDDVAVGYAVRIPKRNRNEAEQWTAYVYIAEPPFDVCRPGFQSADAAAAFIGKHGTPITERNL